jgi:hypothetical protein
MSIIRSDKPCQKYRHAPIAAIALRQLPCLATSFVPHFLLAEKRATVIINQQREAIEKNCEDEHAGPIAG